MGDDIACRDVMKVIDLEKSVTIRDTVLPSTLAFSQIIQHGVDRMDLVVAISSYLKMNVDLAFQLKVEVSPSHCITFADRFISHNFTMPDIVVFCDLMKEGRLAKTYGRVDLEVLSEMLDAYIEIRSEADEQHRHNMKYGVDEKGEISDKGMEVINRIMATCESKGATPANSMREFYERGRK